MEHYDKPLPRPSAVSAPFWEAARRGRLELQYCGRCDRFQYYPRPLCANCWSEDLNWRPCSGRATVYSYSVCHAPGLPAFRQDVPYVVALVELEEGPRITTSLVDCEPGEVAIGMAVEAVFDPVTPDCTLVRFRPRGEPAAEQAGE